jgi:hypothetical protein
MQSGKPNESAPRGAVFDQSIGVPAADRFERRPRSDGSLPA